MKNAVLNTHIFQTDGGNTCSCKTRHKISISHSNFQSNAQLEMHWNYIKNIHSDLLTLRI